eukprot:1760103-Pyramimonas_sp.AAC.1
MCILLAALSAAVSAADVDSLRLFRRRFETVRQSFETSLQTRRRRGTPDQSDAGSAGILSRRINQTREVRVYSRDGPIRRGKR